MTNEQPATITERLVSCKMHGEPFSKEDIIYQAYIVSLEGGTEGLMVLEKIVDPPSVGTSIEYSVRKNKQDKNVIRLHSAGSKPPAQRADKDVAIARMNCLTNAIAFAAQGHEDFATAVKSFGAKSAVVETAKRFEQYIHYGE